MLRYYYFLRLYDKYAALVLERAQKLSAQGTTTCNPYCLVSLKYFIHSELHENTIERDFIPETTLYDSFTDEQLMVFLNRKPVENKSSMTIQSMIDIATRELRMYITDSDANSRIHRLVISYNALSRRNGSSRVAETNIKHF